MASRDRFCCCIPLRFAVFIISIVSIGIGAMHLGVALRNKDAEGSQKSTAYISFAVHAILGISGLLSVFFKTYSLAKNFSTLWWSCTLVTVLLSVASLVLLLTKNKAHYKDVCAVELSTAVSNTNRLVQNTPPSTKDVDNCYKLIVVSYGIVTALEISVMVFCGWIASRSTRQTKLDEEAHGRS
ncbi:hypothetical protein BGZ70_009654 [Mortierella alpina]|uniref:MARVEL domain-containing protein n=1 Tax=Mortierella alpina TaxID=64518 RepID=A0A9P6JD00_MORAP|nr:hypothetical protein BGZ70_009654 [Mortierella alpina]